MTASIFTKRRSAPIVAIALAAGAAALVISELPLDPALRALCLILVILIACREIAERYRIRAGGEVLADRQRVARDLHDGLAQELAFIFGQSKRLATSFDPEIMGFVELAAERALDESRTLIEALDRPVDAPLEEALERAARDVATRAGARVELSVQCDVQLPSQTGEALVRIVREAVTNAVRHGGAENIRVRLVRNGVVCLQVEDDGLGFDGKPAVGFGISSMRQRAEALGGSLQLVSQPGRGTSVKITLP